MSDASMNPNDSAPFDPTPEGSLPQDMPLQGADEFDDQETIPAMDESSWLLEEEGSSEDPDFEHASVHALPDVFAEPPSEGWLGDEEGAERPASEDGAHEDDLVGASYVEPETSGHAFSRALIPGSIVLLLSFGSVGAWAFMKESKDAPAADPVVAVEDAPIEVPDEEPEVELVKPEGTDAESFGRMSYQRDGAVIPAEGYGGGKPIKQTVDSPREPGELPPNEGASNSTGLLASGNVQPTESTDSGDSTNTDDEIDIEFGTYVDSDETSLFEGGDENRDSFQIGDGETELENTNESELVAGSGSSIKSLSPSFLDQFVLDLEPLDEDAVAMLNALEGESVDVAQGTGTSTDDSPEVPVAPLPGDEVYSWMAWTYPSGNSTPMSPAEAYFDQLDGAVAGDMDVAQVDTELSTDAPVEEMGPSLSEDYMPFGLFDDELASLDVEPDIRSLDVTEVELTVENYPSELEPDGSGSTVADVNAVEVDDNLSVGSLDPTEFNQDVASEASPEATVTDVADAAPAETAEPAESEPVDVESAEADTVATLDLEEQVTTIRLPSAEEPISVAPEAPIEVTSADVPAVEIPAIEVVLPAAESDVAQVPTEAIDLNDAHARLDAIFGPTPVEIQPALEAVEPVLAQGSTDAAEAVVAEVSSEVIPKISDEFSAPETLAGTDLPGNAGDTDVPEGEFVGLTLPDIELSVAETPGRPDAFVAMDTPSDGSVDLTVPAEPNAVDVAESDSVDEPEGGLGQGLEVTVTVASPEPAIEDPAETDVASPVAPGAVDMAELKIDPKTLIRPEPVEPTVAMDVEPVTPKVEPTPELTEELESVAVEVRPSLADEVRSPRRGSVLTRVADGDIWPHRTVPKSKLKGDKFVLTPNVGQVRIVFDGGDTLDGRLHGVGANKIAIDNRLGRLTLDARRVDRLDRLGKNNQRTASGEVSTKGLEKVRVQADGGVFLGHLLSREGNRVTLLLSEGMRVTLESDDIRPAGRQKTISRLRRPK